MSRFPVIRIGRLFFGSLASLALVTSATSAWATPVEKEWTLLVFLNGHNNLDRFGTQDMNEMEKVGSNENLNVVVQWASSSFGNTRRVYVTKDNSTQVTSPVIEQLPRVDMGNWQELVNFVKWGVERYPAKKYFIDVWNHGSGWHRKSLNGPNFSPSDISNDDFTGNSISTEELGLAMKSASEIIGRKVDIYGSDACLMAMVEVASEIAPSVGMMIGSQELEPGDGWPYDGFLARWTQIPNATAAQVGQILTEEFKKSYQGGTQGTQQITLSAVDLNKQAELEAAVMALKNEILRLPKSDMAAVVNVAKTAQKFYMSDYRDLVHFTKLLGTTLQDRLNRDVLNRVEAAVQAYVVANATTSSYKNASGVSFWLPNTSYTLDLYLTRYTALQFNVGTGWVEALTKMLK